VTATINYDKHIVNLIDELSRTGHVTHTKYKKKSVTLHHNGGVRFSHQRILSIWRTRPASAHFDVDAAGALAQFVEAHEYAWAVGNTRGNQESISIEMANISAGPHWEVADVTWQAAARLAGWLFAHVIDGRPRPTRSNFFVHKHWSATSCAGPYVDAHYGEILHAAQQAYDRFRAVATPTVTKVQRIQRALEVDDDNKWGQATDFRAITMRNASRAHAGRPVNVVKPFDVEVVQRIVDTDPDGFWGRITQAALHEWIKRFQDILGVTVTGYWNAETDTEFLAVRQAHLMS
jgi:hypothetical protein